jgi:hypothetical protein
MKRTRGALRETFTVRSDASGLHRQVFIESGFRERQPIGEGSMDINGFSFFTDELDELPEAIPVYAEASPFRRGRMPAEGDCSDGEVLSEDAFEAIRSWFGF